VLLLLSVPSCLVPAHSAPYTIVSMNGKFRSLRIGDVEIPRPWVLASLAGYTDLPYRLICRKLGAPFCATEMMLDRQLLVPGRLRSRFLHLDDADHPLAGQIIGNDPQVMAAAAAELCKTGFEVVDLNFACPVRKVLRRCRGGHLMREPALAVRVIAAVTAASERPVTVKLRKGFDDADTDSFWRIAEAAFDAGCAALCVHARTAEQRYSGAADWEFLARVKQRFADRTIIGSGDVAGAERAKEMIEQTGVDGVSIARAAIGNPWVFGQLDDCFAGRPVRTPPLPEQRAVMEEHFARTVALYGPRRGPKRMRKFGIKYARLHPEPRKVRNAFVRIKTPAEWQAVLDEFYGG